jgi:hypothetical protein
LCFAVREAGRTSSESPTRQNGRNPEDHQGVYDKVELAFMH